MLRVVIDPGVHIAAILSKRGAPAGILLAWLEGRFDLVVSPKLLAELDAVLRRPKFRPYVTEEEADAYVGLFRNFATSAPDPARVERVSPDPGDDYLVALARASQADLLVSGDPHLTRLRGRQAVVTPRAFLNSLERQDGVTGSSDV